MDSPSGLLGRVQPDLSNMATAATVAAAEPRSRRATSRPRARGKFLFDDEGKLRLKGVTYGTFSPSADGSGYPDRPALEADFGMMAAAGINAVRTYTVPPRRLLDTAVDHGLRVMVGLPWEQHVAFLEDRRRPASIEKRVRQGVAACAGHPALLGFAIGNEIPAPIVRWHGRRRVERFLERLYQAAKKEDPEALVTYVNFPSTEYLELPFLDFVCFNVYLEQQDRLEAYLSRLHNLAGNRPLVMAEIGLDSRRHGEDEQARVLDWQARTAAAAGCAGAFLFAWTDEWYRGGYEIEDWDFGLTRRDRTPKPALGTVTQAFAELPPSPNGSWPLISVVVCSCNGAETLRDCFDGLTKLEYPNYEVIVVDDGSKDGTAAIAAEYPFDLIRTPNRGLSSARNTGFAAATGEIVAYIDDDARPDPDWLAYLAHTFLTTDHVGVGGPNIAPQEDGPIAACVANAPGGPIHVLLSDREAEHIPGCNMAVRKEHLEEIGGFDPRFRAAGDDVDLCWRLQQQGVTIGFNPAAMVWHHRRNSLRAFFKQQRGYGKAEALLERKWPEKYNTAGHLTWRGRLYGQGLLWSPIPRRWRVYYGTWGSGLFQRLYRPPERTPDSLALMPEWYFLLAGLTAVSGAGLLWNPLLLALPLLAIATALTTIQALRGAMRASFGAPRSKGHELKLRATTAALYVIQPLARLRGRLEFGLSPWRRRGQDKRVLLLRRTLTSWSEIWRPSEDWPRRIETALAAAQAAFRRGGEYDRWDLEVRGGALGRSKLRIAVEEHGSGRQLVRVRMSPTIGNLGRVLGAVMLLLAAAAVLYGATVAAVLLGATAVVVSVSAIDDCARATATALDAFAKVEHTLAVAASKPDSGIRVASAAMRDAMTEARHRLVRQR